MAEAWGGWVGGDDWRAYLSVTQSGINDTTLTQYMVGKVQNVYATMRYGQSIIEWSENWSTWTHLKKVYPSSVVGKGTFTVNDVSSSWSRNYGSTRTWIWQHWFSTPSSSIPAYVTGSRANLSGTVPARPYSAPNVPTNVKLTGGGTDKPTLTWGAPSGQTGSNGATPTSGFAIERQVDGGSWTQVTTVSWSVYTYTDNDAAVGHTYAYRIRAYNIGTNTAGTGNETKYSGYVTTDTVQMGQTIHVYDNSGQVKVGLVTAYDSSGNMHHVKITVYDSSGKAHSVQ